MDRGGCIVSECKKILFVINKFSNFLGLAGFNYWNYCFNGGKAGWLKSIITVNPK